MNLYSTHKNPEHKIIPEVFFYKYGLGVVKGKRRKKRVRKKKKKNNSDSTGRREIANR